MEQAPPFTRPRVQRGRVALAGVGVAVALLAGAAVTGLLWARSYAPLTPGQSSALGADSALIVQPAIGSGGVPVTYPRQGVGTHLLHTGFSVRNGGSVAIRLDGLADTPRIPETSTAYVGGLTVAGLTLLRHENAVTDDTVPFRPVTIQPGEERFVGVIFRSVCRHQDWSPGSGQTRDTLPLRYTYLKVFQRTQDVDMPYAVNLQCFGKIRRVNTGEAGKTVETALASSAPRRRVGRLQIAAAVLGAGLAVTALALFLWVDAYAPLVLGTWGTPGDLRMVTGEAGLDRDVAVLSKRPATVEFDFSTEGRWPVTLESISTRPAPPDGPPIAIPRVQLMAPDMSVLGTYPASALHIRLNDGSRVFVTFRADCRPGAPHTYSTATKLAVRYRYLRYFTRTEIMDAPFALATPCAAP